MDFSQKENFILNEKGFCLNYESTFANRIVTCSGGICQPSHTICQVPLRCPSQQDVRVSGWNGLEQPVKIIVADHKVGVTTADGETGSPCGNVP